MNKLLLLLLCTACTKSLPSFHYNEEVTFHDNFRGDCKGQIIGKSKDGSLYAVWGTCSYSLNIIEQFEVKAEDLKNGSFKVK